MGRQHGSKKLKQPVPGSGHYIWCGHCRKHVQHHHICPNPHQAWQPEPKMMER